MKLTSLILSSLATFCVVNSFAADREKPGRRPGQEGGPPPNRPSREEMLKKFDKDGDGKLNKEEQAALREEFSKNRGQGGRPPSKGNRKPPPQILDYL